MDENQNLNPNPEFENSPFEQPEFSDAGLEHTEPTAAEPEEPRPPVRRRRKRSKWQDFKEAYLPVIIVGVAIVLIVAFISGAISRRNPASHAGSETTTPVITPEQLLLDEQNSLLADAAELAAQYDYQSAMSLLSTYSGGINTSEALMAKYQEYETAFSQLIPYSDISKVPNLGVRLLMADLPRALADETYGNSFNNNYITTTEFAAMLQQLYDNGYMLIRLTDIAPKAVDSSGKTTVSQGTVYLPEGKKPLILTQMGVNFFTYIVDGNGDGLPDKDGAGFASRLVVGPDGKLTSEMVDAEGNTITGSYDLVTILNDFVDAHPDFSYRGARATLAVTGYDGLFGYRTDPETATKIGQEFYNQQLSEVVPVIENLRSDGYEIACMSYDYNNYAVMSNNDIKADLESWVKEVQPLLGQVDIMVFPYGDIGDRNLYTGSKYELLSSSGFRYYVAKDTMTPSWGQISDAYARMTFREITGEYLNEHADWFKDLFDASAVLDVGRNFG